MSNYVREPLLLELQGKRSLSVNIFDQEEYLGCLTVFEGSRPFRSSDRALAVFFSKLLRQAIQQNPILSSTRTAVRRALRSVISGQRIDFEYRRALSMENGKHDWICMKLIPESSGNHLSGTYLSAALEERHPGSFAFEFEDAVVEFLPADQVQKESMDSLTSVLEKLGAICGVSS